MTENLETLPNEAPILDPTKVTEKKPVLDGEAKPEENITVVETQ